MRTSVTTQIAVLALVVLSLPAQAADYSIKKGATGISGSLGFGGNTGDLFKDYSGQAKLNYHVATEVKFFISDHVAIGLSMALSGSSLAGRRMYDAALGPMVTAYPGHSSAKLKPFVTLGVYTLSSKAREMHWVDAGWMYPGPTEVGLNIEYSGKAVYVAAGMTAMLTKHLGLSNEFRFSMERRMPKNYPLYLPELVGRERSGQRFELSVGLSAFLF
ncbi:MAG: porin family protein [candidate division Zixibacteria bacterium]|nr:porin family protein [candidate division Zixibacteria bacterium]MDH3938334.1 porin family protein [candidate division Zixibacteria bacterium]